MQGQSVEPETHLEMCYTIFAIILGVMLLTFIVGSATSVLANVDSGDQVIVMAHQSMLRRFDMFVIAYL